MDDLRDNVIEVDEDIIGYKCGIIKHLRGELALLANDKTVDNGCLEDVMDAIKSVERHGDNTLLRIFVHPMGGFGCAECEVVDLED